MRPGEMVNLTIALVFLKAKPLCSQCLHDWVMVSVVAPFNYNIYSRKLQHLRFVLSTFCCYLPYWRKPTCNIYKYEFLLLVTTIASIYNCNLQCQQTITAFTVLIYSNSKYLLCLRLYFTTWAFIKKAYSCNSRCQHSFLILTVVIYRCNKS